MIFEDYGWLTFLVFRPHSVEISTKYTQDDFNWTVIFRVCPPHLLLIDGALRRIWQSMPHLFLRNVIRMFLRHNKQKQANIKNI